MGNLGKFLQFYLHVLVYPFWELYLLSGIVGSVVSGLLTIEQRGIIWLFVDQQENKNFILIVLTLVTFLNGCRTGLLTYLKHKGYISVVSYFFNNVCLQKLENWDVYYDKHELLQCIHNDISTFVDTTIRIYSIIIRNTLSTILLLYFLAMDKYIYIFFAIAICIARSYFLELLVRYWEKKNDKVKEVKSKTEKFLSEYVSNNSSMQIYGLGDVYKRIVDQSLLEYDKRQLDDSLWYGIFMFCFLILIRFIDIGVYLINIEAEATLENIQITLGYFKLLSESVQSLSDIQKEIKRNKDSIFRLLKYTNFKKVDDKINYNKYNKYNNDETNMIEFKEITFSYPTRDCLIYEDFNLVIKKGEHIALMGDSGKGKTTLIKLLLGLYNPKNGDIFIENKNINNLNNLELRKKICIIPQEPIIFEDKSLKENLELFVNRKIKRGELKKVLKLVKLDNLLDILSSSNRLVSLSGGQKQRLSIARLLLNNSPILILDEAFSAMDTNLKKQMQELVFSHSKRKKKTVILITHDPPPNYFKSLKL